ncbi:MAG: hypothetical protein FJY97_21615, partial [candidate division Zixibacteria bacterium]|nr:hypothetical protein [candidate division Zixibacteria bacterium]
MGHLFALVCLMLPVFFADMVFGQPLPIRRAAQQAPPGPPVPVRHQVSTQNLLGLDRPSAFGLPRPKPAGATVGAVQTLHILAIRVDFPVDTTTKTTGTGRFDLRTAEAFERDQKHVIDRAPHDKFYFERHLSALSAYYQAASFDQLSLTWRVIPDNVSSAYTLPREMAYYSPDVDFLDPLKIERLVEFVEDAFHEADGDPSVTFADYDAFILFHAGSDLQHDRLQNSPS